MAGIIPFLVFAMLWLAFSRSGDVRMALVRAAAAVAVCVVIASEALSGLHALAFFPILAVWGVAAIAAAGFAIRAWKPVAPAHWPACPFAGALLAAIACIAFVTLFIDLIAPPNNWDSMTYHLGRVAHWIQNHSLAHYATSNDRQLYQPPWAEMTILHLKLLAGGDRLVSLVQWAAMVGSVIVVSGIARRLGASARGQIAAAVFCATLPMGILQSTSTQNDYVTAFWLVCLVALLLEPGSSPVMIGACLGLALLTKGTAWLFAAPLGVWVLARFIGEKRLRPLAIVALVVLVLNAGHWARNYGRYGDPLGPGQLHQANLFSYNNETRGPRTIVSNLMRNAAIHLSTPWESVNRKTENAVRMAHRAIGADPDDPATTFLRDRFRILKLSTNEDQAGNPLHFILVLAGLAWLVKTRPRGGPAAVAAVAICGALIFCFYLKWQPWHSRLQLPLFVLWSPLAGLMLGETRFRGLAAGAMIVFIAASTWWLGWNHFRPIFGNPNIFASPPGELVFIAQPDWRGQYEAVTNTIRERGIARVGLVLGGDTWEYPVWTMLGEPEAGQVRIEHMLEDNGRDRNLIPRREPFDAQALVVLNLMDRNIDKIAGPGWTAAWKGKDLSVYVK